MHLDLKNLQVEPEPSISGSFANKNNYILRQTHEEILAQVQKD